ncbi:MAG: hypothetical protein ACOX1P_33250 [Thermoguttaceae bacterium]|jgi:hypothetical protein
MITKILQFRQFSVVVPFNWTDITDSLDDARAPLTIADQESGVGALQFSVALYRSGRLPEISLDDLERMLCEFVAQRGLEVVHGHTRQAGETSLVGGSYRDGDDFVEVFYATDGQSIVLGTYVCSWQDRACEAEERKTVFTSIRFSKPERQVSI